MVANKFLNALLLAKQYLFVETLSRKHEIVIKRLY